MIYMGLMPWLYVQSSVKNQKDKLQLSIKKFVLRLITMFMSVQSNVRNQNDRLH